MSETGSSHPRMFDDDDPVLARVRELALALPEADVKVSHGRPAFFTKRVFAYYGGTERTDDDRGRHDQAIIIRADPDDEPALRQDPRFWMPAYLGPSGWLGFDVNEDSDWSEVAELLDASYRATASPRQVRLLDER